MKTSILLVALSLVFGCSESTVKVAAVSNYARAATIAKELDSFGLSGATIEAVGNGRDKSFFVFLGAENVGEARKVLEALRLLDEKDDAATILEKGRESSAGAAGMAAAQQFGWLAKKAEIESCLENLAGVVSAAVSLPAFAPRSQEIRSPNSKRDVNESACDKASVVIVMRPGEPPIETPIIQRTTAACLSGLSPDAVTVAVNTSPALVVHAASPPRKFEILESRNLPVVLVCALFGGLASLFAVLYAKERSGKKAPAEDKMKPTAAIRSAA